VPVFAVAGFHDRGDRHFEDAGGAEAGEEADAEGTFD
jgi:hypothetical protein